MNLNYEKKMRVWIEVGIDQAGQLNSKLNFVYQFVYDNQN